MLQSSKLLVLCIFTIIYALSSRGYSEYGVETLKRGPIHEAYVTRESGTLLVQAIPSQPPRPIEEQIPPQADPQAQWLAGYWDWSEEKTDFIWISGVWRRPPPEHHWIAGYWKNFEEGWVRLPGFWSHAAQDGQLTVALAPPDMIDERIGPPSNHDFFWMPGYWQFDVKDNEFIWYAGRWETFDPLWVYVPTHYVWREEGYVFIPGYWDWPLENRGIPYASVFVEPDARSFLQYEPSVRVNPDHVIVLAYPNWPDYPCLFQFYFHFQPSFWSHSEMTPSWWWWDSWWSLNLQNTWALWWWWSHPGYPNPSWLTEEMAAKIAPPSSAVVKMMAKVPMPPLVTPQGVVGIHAFSKALARVTGSTQGPILPVDPQEIEDIQILAKPVRVAKKPYLRPEGTVVDVEAPLPKPVVGPEPADLSKPPRHVLTPEKPHLSPEEMAPPPQETKRAPLKRFQSNPKRGSPQKRGIRLINSLSAEVSSSPKHHLSPSDRFFPTPLHMPSRMRYWPRGHDEHFQGSAPDSDHPQEPLQLQDLGRIHSQPQPQMNPPGPKVLFPTESWENPEEKQ